MTPGDIFGFRTSTGIRSGTWGLYNGGQANARYEKLDTLYREYERGIIFVDSFWESGKEFKRIDNKNFKIGIVFNPIVEFAVITCPSNEVVIPVHHRMPLILDDTHALEFLKGGPVILLPEEKVVNSFKLVA